MDKTTDQTVAELQQALAELTIRHSALEWIVEQMLANALIHVENPNAFLDALARKDGRAWTNSQGTPERPTPPREARLYAHIEAIVEKVRKRVRQGPRQI